MSALPPLDSLVFDLDGTLWDTCESCARGWNAVLERHAMPFRRIVADDVRRVAGRPHDACIRDTFIGLSDADLRILSDETAEEDNRMIAQHGGVIYPGVAEALTALARVFPLFIVSNCQAGYIELFLRKSGFSALFRDHECWGNTGRSKAENLADLVARNQLARPWYIGDAIGDQTAADSCGLPFVHAAYGFGQCEAAILRINTLSELARAVLPR